MSPQLDRVGTCRDGKRWGWMLEVGLVLLLSMFQVCGDTPRKPRDDADLKAWLENMVGDHGYSVDEVMAATGLERAPILSALDRWRIRPSTGSTGVRDGVVRVRPYPGGRHPRLGFFDGAIDPQRETKLSVFLPWDPASYVVVDVPEAIFTGAGLVYLAHTHIPTVWDQRGLKLPALEWERRADGVFEAQRMLPDGVSFGVFAKPGTNHLSMRWWMRNGSTSTVTAIRSQVCVMLGRATGFGDQTGENKLLDPPFAACRDAGGKRWIVTAWDGLNRAWQNPPVPCIHSDPRLDDLAPGAMGSARGWIWFYEGEDIRGEIARLRREVVDVPDSGPAVRAGALREPVPERLLVLTFDDSVASHYHTVRPLLKQAGFGATFFITEGFSFATNKTDYLTWEQIAELHRDGFEFHGVPDREHPWVNTPPERFAEYVEWLRKEGYRCIALRDLDRYVDPGASVSDPWAMMDWRRATGR